MYLSASLLGQYILGLFKFNPLHSPLKRQHGPMIRSMNAKARLLGPQLSCAILSLCDLGQVS